MRLRNASIMSSLLALALCAPLAAQAEDAAKGGGDGGTSAASPAQTGDPLGDIIVTARRRAEDAEKVPAALSVIDGSLLDH